MAGPRELIHFVCRSFLIRGGANCSVTERVVPEVELLGAGPSVFPRFGEEVTDECLVGTAQVDLNAGEPRAPVELAARVRPVRGCGADAVFVEHGPQSVGAGQGGG